MRSARLHLSLLAAAIPAAALPELPPQQGAHSRSRAIRTASREAARMLEPR
jgi:hypothetical protein